MAPPERDGDPEVLPVGDVEPFAVVEVQQAIERTFDLTMTQRQPLELPVADAGGIREQYDVESLLDEIDDVATAGPTVAVTDADLLADGREHILGVNRLPGSTLVLSTNRLETRDRQRFRERLRKEALHLVATMYLVDHCVGDPTDWSDCVHQYTPSVSELDETSESFCPACREALDEYLL
ncbi:archaemetzincin-like protein [Salinarchaeum sp. Harcht-Bsk1]|uniref:archemetzincin-like protein n=1 Tax=Salinarchaeum sp. Harcht-Bsk1 TaxID=1333523 RepID=UPI0003423D13|nr:archemetzincin-like protein [Salinarchaeum sp. Harcht-Bsk1]AGN02839.1 archaemetzincin-like protein [Salinarchaeum sp. Harcht-Bsk1]